MVVKTSEKECSMYTDKNSPFRTLRRHTKDTGHKYTSAHTHTHEHDELSQTVFIVLGHIPLYEGPSPHKSVICVS